MQPTKALGPPISKLSRTAQNKATVQALRFSFSGKSPPGQGAVCKREEVGPPLTAPKARGSDDSDLLGRKTFSAWTDFKFDLCSILESSSIHFGVVYEQILSIFLLNEPVTFLVIEPFYATLRHTQYSC